MHAVKLQARGTVQKLDGSEQQSNGLRRLDIRTHSTPKLTGLYIRAGASARSALKSCSSDWVVEGPSSSVSPEAVRKKHRQHLSPSLFEVAQYENDRFPDFASSFMCISRDEHSQHLLSLGGLRHTLTKLRSKTLQISTEGALKFPGPKSSTSLPSK